MIKESDKKSFEWRNLFDITNITLIICIISLLILKYVFVWGYVPTESMHPTIEKGDKIGIFKIVGDIGYGDIIVFNTPKELKSMTDAKYLCKRVIATGGETIEIRLGKVYINDKPIDEESYAESTNDCTNMYKIKVPDNYVFVLGDNRENSYDSRYWENKFVSLDDIEGVIRFKISGLKVQSLI